RELELPAAIEVGHDFGGRGDGGGELEPPAADAGQAAELGRRREEGLGLQVREIGGDRHLRLRAARVHDNVCGAGPAVGGQLLEVQPQHALVDLRADAAFAESEVLRLHGLRCDLQICV